MLSYDIHNILYLHEPGPAPLYLTVAKGVLPVVNNRNKVVGMVTDRDICLALADRPFSEVSKIRVSAVMSANSVHAVRDVDDISVALRQMRKYRVNRLPVTDQKGELRGLLSVDTLLAQAISNNRSLGSPKAKKESVAKTYKTLYERNLYSPYRAGLYLPSEKPMPAKTAAKAPVSKAKNLSAK